MSGSGGDLGGVGSNPADAPRLPDPAAVPYLPDAPRPVAAEPVPEPDFDARAMVEAQKVRANPNPAYGGMPAATDETKEAVEKLRYQAAKQKRRNKLVGRATLAVFCGMIVTAGFLVYRAFQDEQAARDDSGAPDTVGVGAGADDSGGSEPAALTPIGEQAEVIAGLDVLNSGAGASAGGFLGAVDDARAAVDDLNGVEPAAAEPADAPAAPVLPATIDATILRYDQGNVADPVVHHVVADVAGDRYLIATTSGGALRDAAETGSADVVRYDVGAGIATRSGRNTASLATGPDALFVAPVAPALLLPPAAQPYATPTTIGLIGADGQPVVGEAYVVDVEAFRAADAAATDAWLTVLTYADPTAALDDGMPSLDSNLLDARNTIDDMIGRTSGGVVTGSPPIATAGRAIVGWTAVGGEAYVRAAYAASGDGAFQWLYRVTAVDGRPVVAFGVR
ncbi:MAG: hypothetical protein KDB37_04105 [Ilumatobacter sp.]|nr:hypothetical protein [Ilumatobacter sp.]